MSLLLNKIQQHYTHFTDHEKRIADTLIAQPLLFSTENISTIAKEINVSNASITRFCKTIGYSGFKELKQASHYENQTKQHETPLEQFDHVIQEVFEANTLTLQKTAHHLDFDMMQQAVQFLLKADTAYFIGTGGSLSIALDAYYKFLRTGIQCSSNIDAHFQLIAASQMKATDVALIVSHSGKNRETLQIARLAKKNGAKIIAITSHPDSNLARLSDATLITKSDETPFRTEALSCRIAQMTLIEILFVLTMHAKKGAGIESMKKVQHTIINTLL
ncbi:MurR/RpiR family transcriptional regulator [Kurthia senegalensis]|uniref:MurR/RpiR family transcriptional regulator n=1 Tax=Kurthia senegalensis TaxID=1033740 RepID=UPI0002893649|nr:MurR/RpiR family transcriptional regulator [Kurthia senegalensis]